MGQRTGWLAAALMLLAAGCSTGTAKSGSLATGDSTASAPTTTIETPQTKPAGSWSSPAAIQSGVYLDAVGCAPGLDCMGVAASGASYRYTSGQWLGAGQTFSPSAGVPTIILSCASPTLCVSVSAGKLASIWNGIAWGTPTAIEGADGITAAGCSPGGYCTVIDDVGDSFVLHGSSWSGNTGAWGSASSISCVSAEFCMAGEAGGFARWDGVSWSRPEDTDPAGSINAVSCPQSTFCMAVDNSGNAFEWNGSTWSGPQLVENAALFSGATSGLTSIDCPTSAYCEAVDSVGNALTWQNNRWSVSLAAPHVTALQEVSCSSNSFCVALEPNGLAIEKGN